MQFKSKNGIMINVNVSVNTCNKDFSWSPSTSIFEYSKYLKSIADDSATVCIEIISVTNSENEANTY